MADLYDLAFARNMSRGGGTSDYDDLTDKPQINGVTLSGDKSSADLGLLPASTRYGASISANKYMEPVTGKLKIDTILKDQNGNAISTITSDQPVVDVGCDSSGLLVTYPSARASVDLSPAMSGKVDKVQGKGLSTEDYTTAEKNKLANIDANIDSTPTSGSSHPVSSGGVYTALTEKVDKVQGKGLSTEDYTTAEKTALAEQVTKTAGIDSTANNYIEMENGLRLYISSTEPTGNDIPEGSVWVGGVST